MVSLAATCILTITIALTVRPPGSLPGRQRALVAGALVTLWLTGAAGLALAWWPSGRPGRLLGRVAPPAQRAAIWLALAAWFPALLIPVYLIARATQPPSARWIAFGYLDKRWEVACYLLGTLAPMVLLVAATRLLAVGGDHPRSWRAWLGGIVRGDSTAGVVPPGVRWGTAGRVAAGVLTATALAYYFYGPPWYLDRNKGPIGYQADVYLAGLQAISKGATPYIGPAAVQYGPGAQLLSYLYMRHVGTFSVLGFRESWALLQWAGATVFLAAVFLAFGYARGLFAALLATLVYPTLQMLGFQPSGVYAGFFGWANPLRYAGAFALIVLLPAVIRRCPSRRGAAAGAALGLLWGVLCYVAQENLIAGVVGALVIGALLLLSGTSRAQAVGTALAAVLAGFVIAWLPAAGYYASRGALARFAWLYFLVPRAVAAGYSNTQFRGGLHNPWAWMFYLLPFALAAVALLSVCQFRQFRVATGWSRDRIRLVAALVATAVLCEGTLLRSDAAHLSGVMLAVPALVAVAATTLPRLAGARRRPTLILAGAALTAAAFALLPHGSFDWPGVQARLTAPYLDRQRLAAMAPPRSPATVAGQRVGAGLAAAAACCQNSTWSMPRFVHLMDRIHAVIGSRVTYVADFPDGYPGIIYFTADLDPAPVPLAPRTMVLTRQQRRAFLVTFRTRVLPRTQALVTSSLTAPEARSFLRRYGHARRVTLRYRGRAYYVLLR